MKNLNLIRNAREELHRTVQLISYFPRNLIDHDPTDASASLMWNDGIQGFETQSINGVKVGLNLLEQSLLIMREGKISMSITTIEKSFDQVFEELRVALEIEGFDSSRLVKDSPYELPERVVKLGRPFNTIDASALVELYSLAQNVLTEIFSGLPQASEVRCWPHHFDLATLVTIVPHEDRKQMKSIGFGFSPGDNGYDEPYFYLTPWPYPPKDQLYETKPPAIWNTEGWTGGVLRAFEIDSGTKEATVTEFFRTGLEKLKPIV
ncbi:MAG: hypothetical protein AAF149_12605 [Bacteroidota bacterium]